jgi:hypothetical protein
MTPHPPAVVTTTTWGPAGKGWVANVAAASKPSCTVVARITPAWRMAPSKTRSLAAKAPVWDAAARWPPSVAPPFTITSGMRGVIARARWKNARPSPMLST